ncbi:MAG: hypothetical protein ACLRVU_03405 [Beduini sp.]|uniref:hypothetical protein n=1 Tax=Beduini sp. TaxID=1922300 RepID=UPI0039A2F1C5
MAQYIQKKFQQTPLNVGKVEDSLESNSTQNAPSVRVVRTIDDRVTTLETDGVVGDTLPVGTIIDYQGDIANIPTGYKVYDYVPRKQLLINNDFQVNQRGSSEYKLNILAAKLTMDMWYLQSTTGVTSAKLTSTTNSIKIISNVTVGLGQYIPMDFVPNKTYAISFKFDNIVRYCTLIVKEKDVTYSFDYGGKNTMNLAYISNKNALLLVTFIKDSQEHTFEYIDLFEGDIAYPHVKEDYPIALARCTRYLQLIHGCVPITYAYSNNFYLFNTGYSPMANIPSITSFDCWSYNSSGGNINYKSYNSLALNKIRIQLRAEFAEPLTVMACIYDITLSCEPL